MALKTSLVISGDASSAKAALREANAALAKNTAELERSQRAAAEADKAADAFTEAQTRAKTETERAAAALDKAETSLEQYNVQVLETKTALDLLEAEQRSAIQALQEASGATAAAEKSVGSLAAAQSLAKVEADQTRVAFESVEASLSQYDVQVLETKTALDLLEAEQRSAIQALQEARGATAAAEKSVGSLAAAQSLAKVGADQTRIAFESAEASLAQYDVQVLETKTALGLFEAEQRTAIRALQDGEVGLQRSTVSAGQARAGYQNLGRQMQDVTVMLQGGANIGTIISTQGGQVADAVAMMGGRFASVAEFLAGPWGAAIIVGVGLLANLAEGFISAGDEAEKTEKKTRSLVEVLNDSKSSWEEVSQAAQDYANQQAKANETTLHTIALEASAIEARLQNAMAIRKQTQALIEQKLAMANRAGEAASDPNNPNAAIDSTEHFGSLAEVGQLQAQLRSNQSDINALAAAASSVKIKVADAIAGINSDPSTKIKTGFDELRRQARAAGLSVGDLTSRLTTLNLQEKAALDAESKREKAASKKPKKGAADTAAERAATFGQATDRRIQQITDQFSDLPSGVERTNTAMRELDRITGEITKKNPPNLKELLGDIGNARSLIQDSLNKPFEDYLKQAREAAQIDRLLAAGKDDQAAALRDVLQLETKTGRLNDEQLQAVLATVRAAREYSMVLRDQRAIIDTQVRAVQDMRGALEQTVANSLRGRFSVANVLNSLGNAWVNITSQKIVESVFGNTLRALESRASGADRVEAAGDRIAQSLDQGSSAVMGFADMVGKARDAIEQRVTSGISPASAASNSAGGDLSASALNDLTAAFDKAIGQKSGASADGTTGPEIVVNGRRKSADVSGAGSLLVDMADGMLRSIGLKTPVVIGQVLSKSLAKIEKGIPDALGGAMTGQTVSKLILGQKGDGIGSAIGGAIGQKMGEKFLSKGLDQIGGKLLGGLGSLGGPLGSVLGGLAGSLLGGLFSQAKTGYTVVTNNSTSSGGNDAASKQQTSTMGSSLQSTIQAIADKFGAAVGDYAVSIGKRKDYYRVSASGSSHVSDKYFSRNNPDALYDGQDAAQALSLAIQNAISDGAIKGVSAAVQKALKSSSDIDKAIREALKVQDVELAIGGLGAEMEKQFRTFEVQAAERMRIAKQYGFDVIAIDKRNNEDRLKLAKQLADQQVGTLQNLIDQMTSGGLFEGSSVDQRNAILAQIATTKAEADKGTEGAADKLAQLLEQLNSVSKDAYGTTGGFAADRQTILDAARDTIAKANARIAAAEAAAKTDPALTTTNAALDENNAQNADIISALGQANVFLSKISASGSSTTSALAALARTS